MRYSYSLDNVTAVTPQGSCLVTRDLPSALVHRETLHVVGDRPLGTGIPPPADRSGRRSTHTSRRSAWPALAYRTYCPFVEIDRQTRHPTNLTHKGKSLDIPTGIADPQSRDPGGVPPRNYDPFTRSENVTSPFVKQFWVQDDLEVSGWHEGPLSEQQVQCHRFVSGRDDRRLRRTQRSR